MSKNIFKQVKIQGKWLNVDILQAYRNGKAWYALLNDAGCGWTTVKVTKTSGIRVVKKISKDFKCLSFGENAVKEFGL